LATPEKRNKSRIDQIFTSACCPRQYERVDIKRVAYNHVTAILHTCDAKTARNVLLFFFLFFVTLFPREFSGTIEDTDIINTPLELLRTADVPFGGFVDIAPQFLGRE